MASTAFDALERDWSVIARSRHAATEVRSWDEPGLQDLADPSAIVAAVRRADAASSDVVLAVLARRAASSDLAARILLEAVVPGLRNVARSYRGLDDPEEVASMVVTSALDRIRNYPCDRRPNRIAANIVLDTRGELRRVLAERQSLGRQVAGVERHLERESTVSSKNAGAELIEIVAQAVRAGRISADRGQLILESRVLDRPVAEIAADHSFSFDSVRRARQRAEAKLVARSDLSVGVEL